MKFLRSAKCLKNLWNLPEQPAELTQKIATGKTAPHSWYFYVGHYYTEIIKGLWNSTSCNARKVPKYMEFFLALIFPHLDQKKLRIWTLFKECWSRFELTIQIQLALLIHAAHSFTNNRNIVLHRIFFWFGESLTLQIVVQLKPKYECK